MVDERRAAGAATLDGPAFDSACDGEGVETADREALRRLYLGWPRRPPGREEWLDELLADYRHWRLYLISRAGDEAAAREFERVWSSYVRAARGSGFAPADAEELRSLFFERVYSRIGSSYAWRSPFTVYLRTVLVNLARNQRTSLGRRRSREVSLDQDPPLGFTVLASAGPSPEESLLASERRRLLAQALRRLTPLEREILSAFFTDGRSGEELAQSVGIPRAAVYKRAARARARLRALLEEAGLASNRSPGVVYRRRGR